MHAIIRARRLAVVNTLIFFAISSSLCAESLPVVTHVELQPLAAEVERLLQALESTGSPVTAEQRAAIRIALSQTDEVAAVERYKNFSTHCVWLVFRSTPKAG